MSTGTIFKVQIAGTVLLFALMARWYWAPRLARLPLKAALTPLLLPHLSRTRTRGVAPAGQRAPA